MNLGVDAFGLQSDEKQSAGLLSFLVTGVGLEPHVLAKFSAENLASVTSRL